MDSQHFDGIITLASNLLRRTNQTNSPLKPTDFYCEGWMTALMLEVVNDKKLDVPPFRLADGSRWWCEAGLRSPFKARRRGDKLGEGVTWVDGALGHFDCRMKRGIQIRKDATQFAVIEAKMHSRLSSKTFNASGYDQVARNVACMVKELQLSGCDLSQFALLSYHVIAPERYIASHRHLMTSESIQRKVLARIDNYDQETRYSHVKWYEKYFLPLLNNPRFTLDCLTWESVIAQVKKLAPESGEMLNSFYQQC